jgi:hypothetical protein
MPRAERSGFAVLASEHFSKCSELLERLASLPDSLLQHGPRGTSDCRVGSSHDIRSLVVAAIWRRLGVRTSFLHVGTTRRVDFSLSCDVAAVGDGAAVGGIASCGVEGCH